MELIINGKKKSINCVTVSDLLDNLRLEKDMVAVELNKNIVHRENFDRARLRDNDKLEIVNVVGGG